MPPRVKLKRLSGLSPQRSIGILLVFLGVYVFLVVTKAVFTKKRQTWGLKYSAPGLKLLVPRAVLFLGLNPKVAQGVVLWVTVTMVYVFTTQRSLTLFLNHQPPSLLTSIITTTLFWLLVVVLVLGFVITCHDRKPHV